MNLADFAEMLRKGKSISDVFIWASGHDPAKVFRHLENMFPVEYKNKIVFDARGKPETIRIIRRDDGR